MGFFDRILRHTTNSADTAKERLQFVLAHDRSDISTETLDILKDEIITVISKYVDIDREHVEINVSRVANANRLVANIPVIRSHTPRAKTVPRRATRTAQTKS